MKKNPVKPIYYLVHLSLCSSSFCRGQKCCVQVMPACSEHRELAQSRFAAAGSELLAGVKPQQDVCALHRLRLWVVFLCAWFAAFFFFCLFSPSVEAPVPFIVPSLTYWVYLQVVTLMVTSVPFITRCVRRAGEFWNAKAFWWHFRALWGTNVVQNPFGFSIICICRYENINLV